MATRQFQWELLPCEGIGPVRLGMRRDDVIKALGAPNRSYPESNRNGVIVAAKDRYLAENTVEVKYIGDAVTFVGVNRDPAVDVVYESVAIFDVLFRDAAGWLASKNDVDVGEQDFPTTWTFPNLCLCLYRGSDETSLDIEMRQHGDASGLFIEQLAVDKRFAAAKRRACLKRAKTEKPSPVDKGIGIPQVCRLIEEREDGGDRWSDVIAELRG
jgi:hypothetical protein